MKLTFNQFSYLFDQLKAAGFRDEAKELAELNPDLSGRYFQAVFKTGTVESELTYDEFLALFEDYAANGMQAAKNCLVNDYPEYYEEYSETFLFAN